MKRAQNKIETTQWAVINDGVFKPIGSTIASIDPGLYTISHDGSSPIMIKQNQVSDKLFELPDEASAQVLSGMNKFWESEARYRKYGMLYKRGILLHGKPGSGKTSTITLLSRTLIDAGGFVVLFSGPMTAVGLALLRKMNPTARIICIIEDLDRYIDDEDDNVNILSLLDGETQVDGVVWLATTNYLNKLPQTVVNRPSRFDEVIEVPMPSAEAREVYLKMTAPDDMKGDLLKTWVADTEGFSIAHLKELTVAVMCLDHPYELALSRMRKMLGIKDEAKSKQAPIVKRHLHGSGKDTPIDSSLTAAQTEVNVGV